MERQLFTWQGWDNHDFASFTFTGVELVVPIGQFPIGTLFDCADIDFDNADLVLINFEEATTKRDPQKVKERFEFKLTLGVK